MSDDGIKTGDVLVVLDELVVGLADAWPVAVTVARGELHHLKDDVSLESYGFSKKSIVVAKMAADHFGFPLIKPE